MFKKLFFEIVSLSSVIYTVLYGPNAWTDVNKIWFEGIFSIYLGTIVVIF